MTAEPTITIPVSLAGRLLDAIPDWPCCGDVLEGPHRCPRADLRAALKGAIDAAMAELAPEVESELERLRRLAR